MANNGFYGVNRPKAHRRSNGSTGVKPTPRKLYAYTRADQKGTAMETFINGHYDELDKQNNARQGGGKFDMDRNEAQGALKHSWNKIFNTKFGKTVKELITKGKKRAAAAKAAAGKLFIVSFGPDPKNR